MADSKSPPAGPPVPKRGEAAWKADRDRIAARNDEARKEGKRQQREHEAHLVDLRRTAEKQRVASVRKHAKAIAAARRAAL